MSLISRIENAVKEYARHQRELNQIGQKALDKYCGKESHPDCSSLNYISELAQAVQTENPEDTHDAAFMLSNARDDVFILNCYRYNDPVGRQCIDNEKNITSCDLGKLVTDTSTEGAVPFFDCGVESKSSHIDWQTYCCENGFVRFADPVMEKRVFYSMHKTEGDKITCEEARDVSVFNLTFSFMKEEAEDNGISSLSGIECFTNLTAFRLTDEQLNDITPLTGLANLTKLYLMNNQIVNIPPLAGLTKLTYLDLTDNNIISDISQLAGLSNLTVLYLENNQISDISSLAGLINLYWLTLGINQISDVTPLNGLTNLVELSLDSNKIVNITPLAGLTNLESLYLGYNQISDTAPLVELTNLMNLGLGDNTISDITPLAGLINLQYLWLQNNQISDISPLIDNLGIGGWDTLDLRENPLSQQSINEYIPALKARGVTVEY